MNYLIAIIFLAMPAYLIRFSLFGIPTTLLEILIYVVFVIGLFSWAGSLLKTNLSGRNTPSALPRGSLFKLKNRQKISFYYVWPVILMLLAGVISVWVAPDKMVALGQFKALFIDPIMVFWLIISYLKKEDFIWILGGLACSSLVVSIYSIAQKVLGQVTIDNRVVGIFGYSPNYPALFLAPIVAMIMVHSIELMIDKILIPNKLLKIITGWMVVLIGLIAIYFSGSRGALLAIACGLVFYLIVRFWSWIKTKIWVKISLFLVIIAAIILAAIVFKPNFSLDPAVGGRVTSSNNIRYEIWRTSFELGGKSPIFGLGLGNYQTAFSDLTKNRVNFPEYISPWALSPHNIFLMFWLSTGILGLMAFVWLLIIFFQNSFKNTSSPIALLLLSGMVVIIAQGLVDTPYFKNDLSLLFWLIIGFVLLLKEQD